MAVNLSTNGYANHGSSATLEDFSSGTMLVWHKTGATIDDGYVFSKWTGSIDELYLYIDGNTNKRYECSRGRATTTLRVRSAASTVKTSQWQFFAWVWNTAGVDTDQKGYWGDLTTPAAEISYTDRRVGAGTATAGSAGNATVGNRNDVPGSWAQLNNVVGFMAIYPSVLSLAEIKLQQFSMLPVVSGARLFVQYGMGGVNGVDWSGNANNATFTNGSLAEHMPIQGLYVNRSAFLETATVYSQSLAAAVTPSAGRTVETGRGAAAAVTPGAGRRVETGRGVAATVTSSAGRTAGVGRGLGAAVTPSAGRTMGLGRNLAASVGAAGARAMMLGRNLAAAVSSSGAVSGVRAILRSVGATLGFGAGVSRETQRSVSGAVTPSAGRTMTLGRSLAASVGAMGGVGRLIGRAIGAVVGFLGSLTGVGSGPAVAVVDVTVRAWSEEATVESWSGEVAAPVWSHEMTVESWSREVTAPAWSAEVTAEV